MSMAMQVFSSDSPHMGKPAAVSSELPTMRLETSRRMGLSGSAS